MSIRLYVAAAVNIVLLILLLLLRFCFDRALIIFIIYNLNPRTKLIHRERLASNVISHLFLFRNVL